jgi:hypothetical protein
MFDFNHLGSMIIKVLRDGKRGIYLEYLRTSNLSNLIDYKYSISASLNSYEDTLLKRNTSLLLSGAEHLPDGIIPVFLTEKVQKEINSSKFTTIVQDLFNPKNEYWPKRTF